MTSPSNTAWAREEARRLAVLFVGVPDAVRGALASEICASLVAAERKAKEECARIAESKQDRTRRSHIIAAAIRATFPPTSKAE